MNKTLDIANGFEFRHTNHTNNLYNYAITIGCKKPITNIRNVRIKAMGLIVINRHHI